MGLIARAGCPKLVLGWTVGRSLLNQTRSLNEFGTGSSTDPVQGPQLGRYQPPLNMGVVLGMFSLQKADVPRSNGTSL